MDCAFCSNIMVNSVLGTPYLSYYRLKNSDKRADIGCILIVHPTLNTLSHNSSDNSLPNEVDVPSLSNKFRYSQSIYKSLIQKNTRLSRSESAVRCAHQMMLQHGIEEFLRRLSIIIIEDACLHPSYIFILMCILLLCNPIKKFEILPPNLAQNSVSDQGTPISNQKVSLPSLTPKVNFSLSKMHATKIESSKMTDSFSISSNFSLDSPIYFSILQV